MRFNVWIVGIGVFFQIKKEFFKLVNLLALWVHFCTCDFWLKYEVFVFTRLDLGSRLSNFTRTTYFEKLETFLIQQKKNSLKTKLLLQRYRAVKLTNFLDAVVRPVRACDWPKMARFWVTSDWANHSARNQLRDLNQGVKTRFLRTKNDRLRLWELHLTYFFFEIYVINYGESISAFAKSRSYRLWRFLTTFKVPNLQLTHLMTPIFFGANCFG